MLQKDSVIRIRENLYQVMTTSKCSNSLWNDPQKLVGKTRWKPPCVFSPRLPRFEVCSALGVFLALTLPQLSLPCLLTELSDVAMDLSTRRLQATWLSAFIFLQSLPSQPARWVLSWRAGASCCTSACVFLWPTTVGCALSKGVLTVTTFRRWCW